MRVKPKSGADCVPVWMSSGEELTVLAIMVVPSECPKFLLWCINQGSAGLFPVSAFEVSDATLPSQWVANAGQNGYLEFSPADWQTADFWDRYYDDDLQTLEIFHRWKDAITGGS